MDDPIAVAQESAGKIRDIYGNELIGISLYGSAAGKEYVAGKSDINLLVVLTDDGASNLTALFPHVKSFRKKRVSIPLIITEQFIASSLDTFPIEFLNMKLQYRVLEGKDVLADLAIERAYLRTQLERELKGKLLYLRHGFIETEGKTRALRSLIFHSLKTFFFLFNGLIYLKDQPIPETKREKIALLTDMYCIDKNLFHELLDVFDEKSKPGPFQLQQMVVKYIKEMTELSRKVDTLRI